MKKLTNKELIKKYLIDVTDDDRSHTVLRLQLLDKTESGYDAAFLLLVENVFGDGKGYLVFSLFNKGETIEQNYVPFDELTETNLMRRINKLINHPFKVRHIQFCGSHQKRFIEHGNC